MTHSPAVEEYRALWRHYGIEPALPLETTMPAYAADAPEPTPPHHLVRMDGPKEPRIGFVIGLPREDLRFRKDEEALWERILRALEWKRADVLLLMVSWLEPGAPFTWARLRESLPPTLTHLVFFGAKIVPGDAAPASLDWLATHELGRLLRDAEAKKETWTALKDLSQRLK